MKDRLVLHVGPLKTGTTYLQVGLEARRAELASRGWLYPGQTLNQEKAFFGLLGASIPWVTPEMAARRAAEGQALVTEVNAWTGPVLVSAEALSVVVGDDVAATAARFPDRPIRVIITARDLGRIIPSHLTQIYKTGSIAGASATSMLSRISHERDNGTGQFWRMFDIAALAQRWAAVDAVDEVIIVTVPRSGSDAGDLWRRYVAAIGWDETTLLEPPDVPPSQQNLSLTAPEARLFRAISLELHKRDKPTPCVRGLLDLALHRGLAQRDPAARGPQLQIPAAWIDQVSAWAKEDIARLEETEFRVIGDLDDLVPRFRSAADGEADGTVLRPEEAETVDAAVSSLIALYDQVVALTPPRQAPSLVARVKRRLARINRRLARA